MICKETGQKPPKFRDLAKLFADSDADNSGDIDWDEFTVMYVFVLVWYNKELQFTYYLLFGILGQPG